MRMIVIESYYFEKTFDYAHQEAERLEDDGIRFLSETVDEACALSPKEFAHHLINQIRQLIVDSGDIEDAPIDRLYLGRFEFVVILEESPAHEMLDILNAAGVEFSVVETALDNCLLGQSVMRDLPEVPAYVDNVKARDEFLFPNRDEDLLSTEN